MEISSVSDSKDLDLMNIQQVFNGCHSGSQSHLQVMSHPGLPHSLIFTGPCGWHYMYELSRLQKTCDFRCFLRVVRRYRVDTLAVAMGLATTLSVPDVQIHGTQIK